MASLRQLVFIEHPNVIFPLVATTLALPALSPRPALVPLTLLVATLLVYSRIVTPRPHAPRTIFVALVGVSLASTISHLLPSIHALSSPISSILSLWIISSISSFIAFGAILSDRFSLHVSTPWAKITFFPAIWASVWQLIAHISPVGHLVTWSPVTGIEGYDWIRPSFGAWGINWLVGASAVIVAECVGVWFIGPGEEFESDGPLIPNLASDNELQPSKPVPTRGSRHTLLLSLTVLGLAIPSFFLPTVPNLTWSAASTPLSVGCVLPHSPHVDGTPTLDAFIEESKQHNNAHILLWPEGALRFENSEQRDAAFEKVRENVQGPLVGVTFIEPVPASAGWEHSREGKWRNGLVLVGSDGPVAEFYKRNLVPIAESFSMTESRKEPEMYELHATRRNKKWTPVPPYNRPIPLTAAICLDFSSPTLFTSLDSRPALILAPAQTWHHDVSMAVWEQARARAEEAGSMVLFCDGGSHGASGVAGQGMREPVQFGSGSWTRTIGVQWPFNGRRSMYMWGGETLSFVIVWSILGGGWAIEFLALRRIRGGGGGGFAVSAPGFRALFDRVRAYIRERRRPPPPAQGEQQPLLI
ncbi:hypothetical protein BC834DRAFT_965597 [Gloeopeniophorella convolvens]|nr:hypothetical protein BC834DRAFT_965597 [Gloeopeniophorella convolvens]